MSKSAIQQSQDLRANIVLIALGLFIVGIVLLAVLSPYLPARPARTVAPTVAPAPQAFDACVMAHIFIKRQLKAPATADFPACDGPDTYVAHLAGDNWKVSSFVDAENSFGAMLRSDYTTVMRYEPSTDRWTLTDSTLVNH